jgi:hypothetical protein
MPINWPDALATELAERRCIIFMGAGVSMGSVAADGLQQPPGWGGFLSGALALVTKRADKAFARGLIDASQFLDAAEVITECSDRADFGEYLRRTFIQPRFAPSEMHKVILEMDPKIVVTTNYDQIYDHYCESGKAQSGYNVALHSSKFVVENIRSRIRLIIKAHGCVSDPNQIVLSRSSYYRARRDHPGFYQVLDALFLTNTLLFVGCSLTDPDIQLILENVNISAPSSHPHYALIEKTQHRSIKAAIKTTHNIELIEYPAGRHDAALSALIALKDKVNLLRSRTV